MTANSIKTRRQSLGRNRKGAAVVEAALILPVLIFLTLGAIDIAQFITASQSVVNACREGSRIATEAQTTSTNEVRDAVREYLAASYPQYEDQINTITEVTVVDADGTQISGTALKNIESGERMEVVVSFDFSKIRWFPGPKYAAANISRCSTICRRE